MQNITPMATIGEIRVAEIREESDFDNLRTEWESLLHSSGSDTVFLSWEWVSVWWSTYGVKGGLRILAAFDNSQVLRGIAPLRCGTARKYGQPVRALSFIGDGSNDSEYLDFIVEKGFERPVVKAFCAYLSPLLEKGTVLLLNEMPQTSPILHCLREETEGIGLHLTERDMPCGTAQLPDSWEVYLSSLRPRFRTKVRSSLRNLESQSEIRFGFCNHPGDVDRVLCALFDLHTRRWAQDGKPGVFRWQAKQDFYRHLSSRLLDRGWLRFSWLEWNGKILACQYGFAYHGTYFHLQEGYEPASEHWNLGIGLRAWSIREFLREGLRQYDFLGGIKRHKADWGAQVKQSKNLVVAHVTARNCLYCCGPVWEANARALAKSALPNSIVSAVQTYLKASTPASASDGSNTRLGRMQTSLRRGIAVSYYRSGVAVLTRQLRNRYRVSLSRQRIPYLSIVRKTNASARILYYHRVNDENDPFFPATPTRLFEQEMRFIARHYKVVSLGSLLNSLSCADPEDVIAITFDDGYGDNYYNALPVLQRYGLPATIFLTTGSIDSGDPLWFEQLAHAVKTTNKDYLDVEIGIPRRFWMRTMAERLHANDRLFALLRTLDESARREWLYRIFSRLAPTDGDARRKRMLTWEQIRSMHAGGIDFGGHTVTHPFLSKLTADQAFWEVSECKRRIECELQSAVQHFAYPNGREQDFNDCSKNALRRAGYRAAVTTIWGINGAATDPMELRRGQPWEHDAALFACKLDWYQLLGT
jgi:peptidoglycan/xylan/chitin deacetylase (PgdA/CDA1 family)/CelD/BcsL family acetyltransferase involved in cellulose biosynthesis